MTDAPTPEARDALAEALDYFRPRATTKGAVVLTAETMRRHLAVIEAAARAHQDADAQAEALKAERDEARRENDHLRASLANGGGPCPYCALPKEDWSKCADGFPGCGRADDAMLCPHVGAFLEAEADRTALRAKVERKNRALKVFADAADGLPVAKANCVPIAHVNADAKHPGTVTTLTAGDLRTAREALQPREAAHD